MFHRSCLVLLIVPFFLARAVSAALYVPVPASPGKSGLAFSIPYTFGVHDGFATGAAGELEIDPLHLEIGGGEIRFPIAALDSGNRERNCHISESLGLDYAKSDYPKKHVCAANALPADGPNAVVFPQIRFLFRSFKEGKATGTFAMHGMEKEITVPVTVAAESGGRLNVKSTFTVKLSDFGVVVRKILGVGVGDEATVKVDLSLRPKSAVKP